MAEVEEKRPRPQESLQHVVELLRRHEAATELAEEAEDEHVAVDAARAAGETLAELRARLEETHPADIAYILEGLPLDERLIVWNLVRQERDGEILLEVSDAVRESIIAHMDPEELI